jgi:sulfur-oxidizing protein SoxZ
VANQLKLSPRLVGSTPVKIKIKLKLREHSTEVRTLITHPMHTGRLKNSKGEFIPAHFIQEIKVEHNDKVVALCILGSSVSRNPFLKLRFKGGTRGDLVRISWVDNKGERGTKEQQIP